MSLAALTYPAPTTGGLDGFFFANLQHHQALIQAVRQSRGVTMELFQIWPVPIGGNMTTWARQHQRQHDVMNSLLGIPSVDLTGLDLKDKKAMDAWYFQHLLQHQAAGQLCGFPI